MKNYWIFQANPAEYFIVHYFLDDFIKSNPDFEDWWQTQGCETQFSPGDIAYIWKALGEPKRKEAPDYWKWVKRTNWISGQRGIYAVAKITRISHELLSQADIKRFARYHVGDTWITKSAGQYWRVWFQYIINLVDYPLIYDPNLFENKLPRINEKFCRPGRGRGKKVFKLEPHEGELLLNEVESKIKQNLADRISVDSEKGKTEKGISSAEFVEQVRELLRNYDENV